VHDQPSQPIEGTGRMTPGDFVDINCLVGMVASLLVERVVSRTILQLLSPHHPRFCTGYYILVFISIDFQVVLLDSFYNVQLQSV
jgi:hypothetical protein